MIHASHSGMVRQHQTTDAQLRIGESRDFGFDASHRPRMTVKQKGRPAKAALSISIAPADLAFA
jgi:hypothetical protein